MARLRMVTRTVVVTVAEVMCVDVTTAQVQINELELSGSFSDNETLLKAIKKLYENDSFKCVAIQEVTEKEVLYGMEEIEFIKLAKVLPPRTKTDVEE